MHSDDALQQLQELEPVRWPGPGPTYDRVIGNQIRYTVKVLRYERYRRRKRKLEKLASRQAERSDVRDRA